jgi:NAD(P)-dependent dehydrogenase (short-subunit alcohol dehydrogenase family)
VDVAVGVMALKEAYTMDGFDVQMQTNHLSHFLLTSLLLPSLEKAASTAGEARIVNHSSAARNNPATPFDAKYAKKASAGDLGGDEQAARYERYHQTKLANSLFSFALDVCPFTLLFLQSGFYSECICVFPS